MSYKDTDYVEGAYEAYELDAPPLAGRPRKRRRTTSEGSGNSDSNGPGKYVQYHCDYCRKDISNVVRIRCAVCTDFDLCIECFSVGVELGDHKNDHDYRVMENMHFPFLSKDWGADEEQLLLEGLEIYGMGNWEDIAEHVSTKTKEQCKEHYEKFYMQSSKFPLPDLNTILSTREDVKKLNAGHGNVPALVGLDPQNENAAARETRSRTGGKIQEPKPGASRPVDPDLSGYMPNRGEFETEWDNEAEFLIKDIEVSEDDDEETKGWKVRLLEIYNWKLDQRDSRRNVVINLGLHDAKKRQIKERKRPKEEREIYNKTKKFTQVMGLTEYEAFVQNLILEKKTRERIKQLQEYRAMGLKTLTEDAERSLRKTRSDNYYPTRSMSREDRTFRRARAKSGMEVTGKPGAELLSEKELQLCSQLKLYPNQYILIKEALIRESLHSQGEIKKANLKTLVNMDLNKSSRIFDFFEEAGWINATQRGVLNNIRNVKTML